MSPNIQLGMVAALGDDGTGKNTADESDVAQAINWCIETFGADIISLSLGGTQNDGMMREGPSASVTRKAVDMGIFVVAAAGNDGGSDDDGRVSVPSNVARAISVGRRHEVEMSGKTVHSVLKLCKMASKELTQI